MKKIGGIGLCMLWSMLTYAQTITPQSETTCEGHCNKMTLQEKIEYISGYTSFSLRAIPVWEYLKSSWLTGPQEFMIMLPKEHFISFRNTFRFYLERELLYKLGQGLGQDAKAKEGVNILLGRA